MSNEILFRRATFGGFKRSDVLQYISDMSTEHGEREIELAKAMSELAEAKKALEAKEDKIAELKDEIETIKTKLDVKSTRVGTLESELDLKNSRILSLQRELDTKMDIAEDKRKESNVSAERLIQNSISYAESYIQSAGLVVNNVKKETIEKLNNALQHVSSMRETAQNLTQSSEEFNEILEKLIKEIGDASKNFAEDKKDKDKDKPKPKELVAEKEDIEEPTILTGPLVE
ncbi:MAG: hypothetical protein MJ147_07860 [Clostridia bacterium]|nr:hypothetical protein [Clostridia bacterium]